METEMSEKDRLRAEITTLAQKIATRDEQVASLQTNLNRQRQRVVEAVEQFFEDEPEQGIEFLKAAGIDECWWGDFGKVEYEVRVNLTATLEMEVTKTVMAYAGSDSDSIVDALEEDGWDPYEQAECADWGEGEVTSADWEVNGYEEA